MNSARKNYKYLLLIAMLYATFSVSADVVAFKFSVFFNLIESGATIIFPLTYVLADITTEVYGWHNAVKIVWFGLICEAVFAGIIMAVINLPNSENIGVFQSGPLNFVYGQCPSQTQRNLSNGQTRKFF